MPTKYRGSLGGLTLIALIAISLGCPLWATAQQADAVVAIDPPQSAVDAQETFSVAVTISDVSELGNYEFTVTYDPAVVEVEAVEHEGTLLESKSPIWIGPDIDNEAGTVTFGVLAAPGQSGPWPSGPGELATIRLRAVGDGFTALDLQDVELFGGDGDAIAAGAEDGEVQVGEGARPTNTPTREAAPSDTPTPTSAATATDAATSPPEATATKTTTGGATTAPEATATEGPTRAETSPPGATATGAGPLTEAATSPPGATATRPPTEGGAPAATAGATSTAGPGETPVGGGSPSATAEPLESEGETAEPAVTSADEPSGGETPSGVSPWWIVAAAVLALAGVALIGGGVYAFGLRGRPGEEPMDDDSKE